MIIDDGVTEGRFYTGSLVCNYEIDSTLILTQRTAYDTNKDSHGTFCAAIIQQYAPDAKLGSIKIIGGTAIRAQRSQLLAALQWCRGKRIGQIHMSIGTTNFRDFKEIHDSIYALYEEGTIVVAAYSNNNQYTLPAGLSCVIGVQRSELLTETQFSYAFPPGLNPVVLASGIRKLSKTNGEVINTPSSNSFAAPFVSAVVYNTRKITAQQNTYEILEAMQGNLCYVQMDTERKLVPTLYDMAFCEKNKNAQELENLWNEALYVRSFTSHKPLASIQEMETPCVYIYGEQSEITCLAKKLAALFAYNGYYAIVAGQFPCAYKDGFAYIDKPCNKQAVCNTIESAYACDIILCAIAICDTSINPIEAEADIVIVSKACAKHVDTEATDCFVFESITDSESHSLYNQITHCLEVAENEDDYDRND